MDERALKNDIEIELENLRRLEKEMEELLARLMNKSDFIETRAAGSKLKIFQFMEKILIFFENN